MSTIREGGGARLSFLVAVALALAGLVLTVAPAAAEDVTGEVTTDPPDSTVTREVVQFPNDNNGCEEVNSDAENSFKTPDDDPVGTFEVEDGVFVTVEGNANDGYSVSIDGGALVDVLLKSSQDNNAWYNFDPPVVSATPLFAPEQKAASHIWFCYNVTTQLQVDKTAVDDPVTIGDRFGYDITVSDVDDSIGADNVTVTDPLAPEGHDWEIASQDGSACSISDSDGDGNVDDLTCSFSSLSDGASYSLRVTSTSTATAAACDTTATNTVTARADNATEVSDDASITVQCGAVAVDKNAKHADTSGDTSPNLAATFQVTDSNGATHQVSTDQSTGQACLGDLPTGEASVVEVDGPSGYAKDTDTETVSISDADCSSADKPVASFRNIPQTDVSWTVNSQHDGATSTTVVCKDADGNTILEKTVSDGSATISDLLPTAPDATVTCQFTVDP